MKSYSIEGQLSKWVALLIALIVLSVVLIINLIITDWLKHEFDGVLEAKASVLVTLVKDTPKGVDFDFADEFMPEFEAEEAPEYFQLWTDNQDVFERSHSLKTTNLPYLAIQQVGTAFQDIILADRRRGRMIQIVFIPQIPEHTDRTPEKLESQRMMTLAVARERETLDQIIELVHLFSIAGTVVILIIIGFLVKYVVRNSLKPLFSIKDQIKVLDANNLNTRLDINNPPDELKGVIDQFNQMVIRLEQSFQREQQFSSDVAHELRTPIAELRSMSEVALKWPEDVNLVKEFLSGVRDASQQMQLIINNLLTLARCEKGDINLEPEKIVLNEMVEGCWRHAQNDAQKKNLSLVNHVPNNLTVMISATEFELIIKNLISNAISYSPDNTEVMVDVNCYDDSVRLVISNVTEQLDQSDLALMFDRLWRKSKSRSSSLHSGLGLSLVKAYIDLIGLRISVNLSDRKIISFYIDEIHVV